MGQPEKTFRQGTVSASIFANDVEGKDGKSFKVHKVVVQRSYKDKNGKWGRTDSLDLNSVPRAIFALGKAYEFLTCTEKEEE